MQQIQHAEAREIRDLSIELIADLDRAVGSVKEQLKACDLDAYRSAAGWVMGEIAVAVLTPLFASHPELQPDEESWMRIARHRLGAHAGRRRGSVAAELTPKLERLSSILGGSGRFALDEAVQKLDEMDAFVAA